MKFIISVSPKFTETCHEENMVKNLKMLIKMFVINTRCRGLAYFGSMINFHSGFMEKRKQIQCKTAQLSLPV